MNPFKYGNIVQDEFFTDRAIELERVKQAMVFFAKWIVRR